MDVYAVISTRTRLLSPVTKQLLYKFKEFGVEVKLMVGQRSIFEAYEKGVKACDAGPDDVIIMCHDDIEIVCDKTEFYAAMAKTLNKKCGFIGPAGTTRLESDAVWWNHENWRNGKHRGRVLHQKDNGDIEKTFYGDPGRVVVLDGLFLAARKEVLDEVGLSKPDFFEGRWDFYDILYTHTAHKKGYSNYVVTLDMLHHSIGDTTGRDSWHNNRKAFIESTNLPIEVVS